MGVKYALFIGCTIPVRAQHYELSARRVASALGIELIDIEEFACCGFPIKSVNTYVATVLAARNIAIAEEAGLNICTLCNACTGILTEVQKKLNEDEDLRKKVNKELEIFGKKYNKGVSIKHFSRILYENVGLSKIKEKIKVDLKKLRLAAHYGCHYLKPSEIYDGFDSPEAPHTLDDLISVTGAETIDYKTKLDCCGGAILGIDENIALSMANKKLSELKKEYVDALVSICPFCSIMYEDNQRKIEAKFGVEYKLPVIYYPQLLGLALGFKPRELGFMLNRIKATQLIEKL